MTDNILYLTNFARAVGVDETAKSSNGASQGRGAKTISEIALNR